MNELLKEYTQLVGKVAHANYTDTEKDIPRIVELREEISRRLKIFARIKYNCEQSINRETKVKLSTLEEKEGEGS